MLILLTEYLLIVSLAPVFAFISENLVAFIIGGAILLVLTAGILLFRKNSNKLKKKKNKQEVTPPVYEIIGDDQERLDELNNELKNFGFAYEPYQDIFYSLMHPWQRDLGYCRLYDEASATMSMIIDCEPIPFEYNGRRWLIQFWKGQYGMTTGGEVGIYYTTGPDLNIPGIFNGTFYQSVKDEDCINMSFAFRKNGNLLFTRSGYHWWLTGFKLGEFSKPSELTMDIVLDLYDRRMVTAFTEALRKAGYKEGEYSVQGRRVMIYFDKPHTSQPLTRTKLTEFIMQKNNESFCNAYHYLTSEYTDTLDKLEIVKNEAPNMYNMILNVGKPKGVFDAFNTLKRYIK